MNGENKFLKIFALVAFLAFAAVSCWSTTESLFLTLENAQIPKWVFWIAVTGLYVLTSICTKLVLDSFNQNIYVEHRIARFVIGLLGVLLLWLVFSMPTNAHTFFYKQMAKNTAVKELKHIDGELETISNEHTFKVKYEKEWEDYKDGVNSALAAVKSEIFDFQNKGAGDKTEACVVVVEERLGIPVGDIARIKPRNNTQKELNRVYEHYAKAVEQRLANKEAEHNAKFESALLNFQEKMKNVPVLRRDIKTTLDQLDDAQYDKEAVLKNARILIGRSYAELESQLNGHYTYDENVYRSDRLVKVTKVWGDYFKGRFKNTDYTLWYWILLSIIVDIAAFAFFDIAFKHED